MPKYPLHLLEALVVAGDSPNLVEAAGRLGLSQPALSKQLKALEEILPQRVFTLKGRKKCLTPFGRDLHERIRGRLSGLEELVGQAVLLHADPAKARVRLAARREILDRVAHRMEFPGEIVFREAGNPEIVSGILAGEIEIGIVHQMPNTHELNAKPLFRDAFVFAVPRKFGAVPLEGEALWDLLRFRPCIGYKFPDEILAQVCGAYGYRLEDFRFARSTSNYASVAKMVEAGLGWAVMPAHIPLAGSQAWSVAVPARAFAPRQFHGIYRPELKSSPWFKPLWAELERCFREGEKSSDSTLKTQRFQRRGKGALRPVSP